MAKQENSEMASEFVASMLLKIASFTPETFPKRMTKKEKEMADKLAALSFQFRHDSELFYFSNGTLYKERENYTRNDAGDVPRYVCFPEGLSAAI